MSGDATSPGLGARLVDAVVDRGLLPDAALRAVIRLLLSRRLASAGANEPVEDQQERKRRLITELSASAVALSTEAANEQHYEVPTELFQLMLGPHLKYSSGYWPAGVDTLRAAEEAMLELTCRRAGLADGQDVLELGCGWGSLTLWAAERYPSSSVTAVSNSATQGTYIAKQARERDLDNITTVTADINDLDAASRPVMAGGFDRVVSVEMFEHVRNHAELLARIASWLREDGRAFVHHFAHRHLAYPFESGGRADWMARHFFTDGLMPSHDLLLHFPDDLVVDDQWALDGTHYAATLGAWLERLDGRRDRVLDLFADTYGPQRAGAWLNRWRVFLIACQELFAYRSGREWHVTHVRLRPGGSGG